MLSASVFIVCRRHTRQPWIQLFGSAGEAIVLWHLYVWNHQGFEGKNFWESQSWLHGHRLIHMRVCAHTHTQTPTSHTVTHTGIQSRKTSCHFSHTKILPSPTFLAHGCGINQTRRSIIGGLETTFTLKKKTLKWERTAKWETQREVKE